ncbi:MAG TPA: AAA family ATPase [Candidatus Limiplasma sp.]|nr:AAA family ATPase [Candidatus Limiplasma sp.]
MSDSVLQKTLKKCREAMLGGVPILYIKTESGIFIQRLIEEEYNPLVVRICGESCGCYGNRPVSEYLKTGKSMDKSTVANISCDELPNSYSSISFPRLWAYKMPGKGDVNETFRRLEKYVLDHENANFNSYSVLQSSAVILYSSEVLLSPMLQTYTEVIEVDYPDEEEIRNIILFESGGDAQLAGNERYLAALSTDFLGFSTEEIATTMQRILAVTTLDDSKKVEDIISGHKKQKLQSGILEHCEAHGDIGGMDNFKSWLQEQVRPLRNSSIYKRKTGTPPPKGVLLCGIPGCGKSEAAKVTAQTLHLPLLKMEIGSLMDKYQGVSEHKMQDALKMAEAMAPCVLWIDELEKGFSGAGSNDDSAAFKRMFGYMLGWMQDNQKPCFIYATANNIGGLPKEFFRSGRFDALYAVYLPTADECVNIFKKCLEKAVRSITAARHLSTDAVIDAGCFADSLYKRIINDMLIQKNGKPRIVIGSDIQKIVNIALRTLVDTDRITAGVWASALQNAIIACSSYSGIYGDSEENIDSIAISYCRMLRKGFIPAATDVLFRTEDYHIENLIPYERESRLPTGGMSEEERAQHEKKLRETEILQGRPISAMEPYDKAVYTLLKERINAVALPLEKSERQQMIVR